MVETGSLDVPTALTGSPSELRRLRVGPIKGWEAMRLNKSGVLPRFALLAAADEEGTDEADEDDDGSDGTPAEGGFDPEPGRPVLVLDDIGPAV
jgi:hypothetical protein